LIGCENDDTKYLSATATAYKNSKGEVVVEEATVEEVDSLPEAFQKMKEIDSKYPAPPTPLKQETFAVRSITEDGIFILEDNLKISLSGIKCDSAGVHYIRKFFIEETERLAYLAEEETSNGTLESYAWQVDSSMLNDPEMKKYDIGPSFFSVNDLVIQNNWCGIDHSSGSRYISRYGAIKKELSKNNR